ncbi:MAG: hypothetical protein C4555_05125 [Dehalococcoidia bacterium]|nr:MAG: hypothetical protein C4555_05125 [Dehalococcoidia bacterium]
MKRFLVLVVLAAILAGCSTSAVTYDKWQKLDAMSKAKVTSTSLRTFYNVQYDQYLLDYQRFLTTAPGPVKNALAGSLMARKKAFIETESALNDLDACIDAGGIPPEIMVDRATDLLLQIGGY